MKKINFNGERLRFIMKLSVMLFITSALIACIDTQDDKNETLDSQLNVEADLVVKAGKTAEVQLHANTPSTQSNENVEFQWQIISAPENSQAALSNNTSDSPTFTADIPGIYVTRLITTHDGLTVSSSDITVKALPFIAYAGPDQIVKTGATVILNEQIILPPYENLPFTSGAEGDPVTHPNGEVQPSGAPNFNTISELPPELPPEVEYSTDDNTIDPGFIRDDSLLPATGEFDFPSPDGQFLTISLKIIWSFISLPEGSSAVLSDINAISPSFVADIPGNYAINMEVDDGLQKTTTTVNVIAYDFKAIAGYDSAVIKDSLVQLDGSRSWNIDGELSYQWSYLTIPSGSSSTLSDDTSTDPTFIADVDGTYVIELQVSNGSDTDTDTDTVAITAFVDYNVGAGMRASAGQDRDVKTGASVTLQSVDSGYPGAFGFPENLHPGIEPAIAVIDTTGLSYFWSFVSKPENSEAILSNTDLPSPSFVADVQGEYVVELEISDGTLTNSDIVVITAHDLKSVAGGETFTFLGENAQLDGSGSWSINDDLVYQWALDSTPDGSNASLSDATISDPMLNTNREGTYQVSLTVSDGTDSDTSTMLVYVMSGLSSGIINRAYAGQDQSVKIGETVKLNAEEVELLELNSDLKNVWTLKSIPTGSAAKLTDPNSSTPTFAADKEGDYVVMLEVHDAQNVSVDEVIISAFSMKAMAGYDQFVPFDTVVELNGQNSWNLAGPFTYQWKLLSTPTGSEVTLTNTTSALSTLTPDIEGSYTVELKISDETRQDKDTVIIHSGNSPIGIIANTIN